MPTDPVMLRLVNVPVPLASVVTVVAPFSVPVGGSKEAVIGTPPWATGTPDASTS